MFFNVNAVATIDINFLISAIYRYDDRLINRSDGIGTQVTVKQTKQGICQTKNNPFF